MKLNFKGHIIQIDICDLHYLESHNWYIHPTGKKIYLRGYLKGKRKSGLVYFHKLLLPLAKEVDHRNTNGLDNRRKNLRECDRTLNNANRIDLGSKGVHFESQTGKYRALIHIYGKKISIGRFKTFLQAKKAYNQASLELFGEFSNTKQSSCRRPY